MAADLNGVLPVVPTPFLDSGELDLRSLANLIDFAVDAGASALVYPGVASEDVHLTPAERAACLQTAVRQNRGRLPIVAGVNSKTAQGMVDAAEQAAASGADMIMAMAIPDMGADYVNWFKRISAATEGRPIILQNLFAPRGADLSAQEMLNLAEAIPAIHYVKEEGIPSGVKVSALVAAVGGSLKGVIGGGGARYVFEELERGAVATMPAIELLELHVGLLNAYFEHRRDHALELYTKSLPLLLIQAPYRMRMTKHILKHKGLIKSDFVREPLPEMDDQLKHLVLELYEATSAIRETSLAS
ncbi:dihydrodipicolinate synthase family protein [Cognatishimia sp. SS12]|uniref:dihydrodipicolinate synthase family protein n=1 Tax=Cognatishimia sp. SS12 TaxID=2979465 RepID=UPI00232F7C4F|nr:dihydrodipicolinate synthase family protein [Cognatishimia sp. SS12]MDC0738315.1 dihydrodipicolinate synthase family protein [Cognatishimia sp. SS12]